DFTYIMSSTPVIASSSGVATVSAITLGLAPGYTVRTTTDGGTTSGYSPIGNSGIEIRPAAKITIDSTAAKIGRSMKNLEKSMGRVLAAGPRSPRSARPGWKIPVRRPSQGRGSGRPPAGRAAGNGPGGTVGRVRTHAGRFVPLPPRRRRGRNWPGG